MRSAGVTQPAGHDSRVFHKTRLWLVEAGLRGVAQSLSILRSILNVRVGRLFDNGWVVYGPPDKLFYY
jgi:hypothetical protein